MFGNKMKNYQNDDKKNLLSVIYMKIVLHNLNKSIHKETYMQTCSISIEDRHIETCNTLERLASHKQVHNGYGNQHRNELKFTYGTG